MKSILQRLTEIEAKYRRDPLVVLAELDGGGTAKMTMRECLQRTDARFLRIVGGSALDDLDKFLGSIAEDAKQ